MFATSERTKPQSAALEPTTRYPNYLSLHESLRKTARTKNKKTHFFTGNPAPWLSVPLFLSPTMGSKILKSWNSEI